MSCRWEQRDKQYDCKYCAVVGCEDRKEPADQDIIIARSSESVSHLREKDEIDEWLEKECCIYRGACSSISELKYGIARMVAEKLWKKKGKKS